VTCYVSLVEGNYYQVGIFVRSLICGLGAIVVSLPLFAQSYSLNTHHSFSQPIGFEGHQLAMIYDNKWPYKACKLTFLATGKITKQVQTTTCRDIHKVSASSLVLMGKEKAEFYNRAGQKLASYPINYDKYKLPEVLRTGEDKIAFFVVDKGLVEFDSEGKELRILAGPRTKTFQLKGTDIAFFNNGRLYIESTQGKRSLALSFIPRTVALAKNGNIGVSSAGRFELFNGEGKSIRDKDWKRDVKVSRVAPDSQVIALDDGNMALLARSAKRVKIWLPIWTSGPPTFKISYELSVYNANGRRIGKRKFNKKLGLNAISAATGGGVLLIRQESMQPTKMLKLKSQHLKTEWEIADKDISYAYELIRLPNGNIMTGTGAVISPEGKTVRPRVYQGFGNVDPIIYNSEDQIFMPHHHVSTDNSWQLDFYATF